MTAKKNPLPQGLSPRPDITKIAVSFSDALFKSVMAATKREKKSFNYMVVELVTVGKPLRVHGGITRTFSQTFVWMS
jgi:hypothetical protein